jgi:hypothetical protein
VHLADYGVHLKKNVQYKWFVTIVTDPEHRSEDILAGGIVSMIDAPAGLTSIFKEAVPTKAVAAYAEQGLWYDSLGALSVQFDKQPGDAGLRKERVDLLEQVGLLQAAAYEKNL